MSQTLQGAEKMRQTMIAKHGSEEAWREHMRAMASKGGSRKFPNKGFAHPDHDPRAAGKKGGSISKRGKRVQTQ